MARSSTEKFLHPFFLIIHIQALFCRRDIGFILSNRKHNPCCIQHFCRWILYGYTNNPDELLSLICTCFLREGTQVRLLQPPLAVPPRWTCTASASCLLQVFPWSLQVPRPFLATSDFAPGFPSVTLLTLLGLLPSLLFYPCFLPDLHQSLPPSLPSPMPAVKCDELLLKGSCSFSLYFLHKKWAYIFQTLNRDFDTEGHFLPKHTVRFILAQTVSSQTLPTTKINFRNPKFEIRSFPLIIYFMCHL